MFAWYRRFIQPLKIQNIEAKVNIAWNMRTCLRTAFGSLGFDGGMKEDDNYY
jgi:hypothetical protein